ncbi:MAG: GNAT family N-acetyltransferase [Geminicoccaceae bacterium]
MVRQHRSEAMITVRHATPAELPACAELYARVDAASHPWNPPNPDAVDYFLSFAEREEIWLAEIDGRLAGILSLFRPESFVHSLYVEPAFQGRGVGRALLDTVQATTPDPLSLKVEEPAAPARAFYAHLGFVELGDGVNDLGIRWIRLQRAKPQNLATIQRRRASTPR